MADPGETVAPTRDRWGTTWGFMLAAVGSAIGLGNIWRFPYVVYENGGGAFLIPYFVALATAAIPILILEYGLGHRSQHGAPVTFRLLSRKWEWLGWWQIATAFLITTYYAVIVGWALSYVWFSVGTQWGDDSNAFFFEDFLGMTPEFWTIGGLQWQVLIGLVLVWAIVYWILRRGVPKGIELTAKILIPLLVVMVAVIVIRGITLEGAETGLKRC